MNVTITKACAPADQLNKWASIDWNKCAQEVRKLQVRIVKAQKEGRYNKAKALQWLLTHSFFAKALAVKRVTSNKGKNTSGVDHALWISPNSKYQAVNDLKRRGYVPQPLKRVHIKKSNGKLRPLGIPTMKDRAMQALYLMALEPVAETTADGNSYGFRRERSTADARGHCFNILARQVAPEWVLEADIKGCFDHISHDWLLANIPMDKVMLRKWLKCGFIFNKELFLTEEGTPQGGIISPTLANMCLDGLQTLLGERFYDTTRAKKPYKPKVVLVRYADDFIITGLNQELLQSEVLPVVRDFLSERGLQLSEEKTKITHIEDGFDFLGFTIRKYDGKFLIKPAKEKLKKFSEKVAGIIHANRTAPQEMLIRKLNPVITGWANYYCGCNASSTFRNVDALMFKKLWQWSIRRHQKKGKHWIADKYFRRVGSKGWLFAADIINRKGKEDTMFLKRMYDTKIIRYVKIKRDANPFDPEWDDYFKQRETYKMLEKLNGKRNLLYLWNKQKRVCPICEERIDRELEWSVTEKTVNGHTYNILVHDSCHRKETQSKRRLS